MADMVVKADDHSHVAFALDRKPPGTMPRGF
jgi:hypothetical protein